MDRSANQSQLPTDAIVTLQFKDSPLSFNSTKQLRSKIDLLPSGAKWKARVVEVEGGSTRKPLILYYRDGLECLLHLLSNPMFQGRIQFRPRRNFSEGSRLYSEIMSGDLVWDIQVRHVP